MKVLLAGGDDEVAALSGPLASAGWDVISAADAATALMLARRDPPDAVVVTAALPGGRGHGLVERLRHLAPTSMVPVVGLASEPELVAALDAAGADRCLPADVDPDELFAQLVEVTGGAATVSASRRPRAPAPRRPWAPAPHRRGSPGGCWWSRTRTACARC
jgi:two-component system, OmpR family, KDP operon response regulator KdpE